MPNKTAIGWTDYSSNPIRARRVDTGQMGHFCVKVSAGCKNCYASKWNEKRFGNGLAYAAYNRDKVEFVLHEPELEGLRRLNRAAERKGEQRRVFICDMTDLFQEGIPDEMIGKVWLTMVRCTNLTFQVLTKRPKRLRSFVQLWFDGVKFDPSLPAVPPNIWLMTSVEDQETADERLPVLLDTPAAVRGVSVEPLLAPVDLTMLKLGKREGQLGKFDQYLDAMAGTKTDGMGFERRLAEKHRLHWVIVGGESGAMSTRGGPERALVRYVPPLGKQFAYGDGPVLDMHPSLAVAHYSPKPEALDWVRSIRDQCQAAGVPLFFKQWGGPRPTSGGRTLDGREWGEMPSREAVGA